MRRKQKGGIIYSVPPFQLFNKCKHKAFYIFGDFNAKHSTWGCNKINTSGVHIFDWLEATGNDLIIPQKATSKRSNSTIDFGLTHDATGWNSKVLEEATSDHWPILFQAPITIMDTLQFKQTNWKIFTFILTVVYQYCNSLVYNLDTETVFLRSFRHISMPYMIDAVHTNKSTNTDHLGHQI